MITKQGKILALEFTVIILLWTLAIISPLFFIDDYNQNWRAVHVLWTEFAVIGVAHLVHRFMLMRLLFFKKKYLEYFLTIVVIFVCIGIFILNFDGINTILSWFDIYSSAPSLNQELIRPPHPDMVRGIPPPLANNSVIPPDISVLILMVIVLALDMGLSIAVKWIISEQNQAQMSKERVATQLANLQNQVSPHFFMNTLNNIHALVEIDKSRAQKTIIELSSLMDYLLYESSQMEKVSLNKELEFTQNYISLMRLRYPNKVSIEFNYDKDLPKIKIPPLLFLNFIENTFKYGVNYSKNSFIKINFQLSGNQLEMTAINSNHAQIIEQNKRQGIGITNAEKRLKLLYGNDFSLKIKNKPDIYSVNLKIPIQ